MHAFSLQLMHRQAAGSSLHCLGRIRDARALLRTASVPCSNLPALPAVLASAWKINREHHGCFSAGAYAG